MKKMFTLAALGLSICSGAYAQQGEEIPNDILERLNHEARERRNQAVMDREEINGWVSFELTQYDYVHGEDAFYTYGQVVSPDSLPRVSFTGGVYSSFLHGFGQIFDPTAEDMELSDQQLTLADGYSIDSIGIPTIYRRVNHNGIDDTLVITVAVTDKETEGGNPYDGSYWWSPSGLLTSDIYVMAPSYAGDPAHGYHHGLTGTSDAGENVTIQQYKFALTEDDTESFWRSYPVDITADPNQVVYTFVEFKPSFESTSEDTAFVFDGALGEANTNSFRTIYDYPKSEIVGYFFDLYREDNWSYNASYVASTNTRYAAYTGDDEWRNSRLDSYSTWGFRFEYYMNATSSVGVEEETANDIMVYPNPAKDQVVISGWSEGTAANIEIVNLDGKLVYQQQSVKHTLILNPRRLGLSKGVYFVSISTENGSETKKLLVE